jgi:hypothetical protein
VHDIDLGAETAERGCHSDVVVAIGALDTEDSVGKTPSGQRKRPYHLHILRNLRVEARAVEQDVNVLSCDPPDLMQGGRADPRTADSVREAVEHLHAHSLTERVRSVYRGESRSRRSVCAAC